MTLFTAVRDEVGLPENAAVDLHSLGERCLDGRDLLIDPIGQLERVSAGLLQDGEDDRPRGVRRSFTQTSGGPDTYGRDVPDRNRGPIPRGHDGKSDVFKRLNSSCGPDQVLLSTFHEHATGCVHVRALSRFDNILEGHVEGGQPIWIDEDLVLSYLAAECNHLSDALDREQAPCAGSSPARERISIGVTDPLPVTAINMISPMMDEMGARLGIPTP